MKMTQELLTELGSCGDYVHTFRRLFPSSEFPDGVEINEEVCWANAGEFPWYWAVEQMLSGRGGERYHAVKREIQRERNAHNQKLIDARHAWQEKHGEQYAEVTYDTSREARDEYRQLVSTWEAELLELGLSDGQIEARAFGRVFSGEPDLRSNKVNRAHERVAARVEESVISAYTELEARLKKKRAQLAELTRLVPELEEQEAKLRLKYVPAKARKQAAAATRLAQEATERARIAAEWQTRADEAQAEAEKLAAEAEAVANPPVTEEIEETEATVEATEVETTTDDTASSATTTETPSSE